MANNSFVEFFWISSFVSKRRLFKVDINLKKSLLEPNLESRVAGVQRLFCFWPENCAQGTMSELVHCRGAALNSGSFTPEASTGLRLFSNASELLRKTPCLLSEHVERIRGGLYLASQRKPTTSHSCWFD
jgi:hypothetical protein